MGDDENDGIVLDLQAIGNKDGSWGGVAKDT